MRGTQIAFLLGTLAIAAGCADDDRADDGCRALEPARQALFGADPDAGGTDVSGVVALLTQVSAQFAELCSGTLIAPNLVLTARHCLPANKSADVFFGSSIDDADDVRPVTEVFANEDRDLAVAVLLPARGAGPQPTPLPLAFDDAVGVGETAKLAGFGRSERGFGQLLFVDERIADFDDEFVLVDGEGKSGACTGDSGGPLLLERDGQLRVLGVLSGGSASCTELDVYQRVAPVERWLQLVIEQTEPQRNAAGGGC